MPSHNIDYPATIQKLRQWVNERVSESIGWGHNLTAYTYAIDTGEGDPNNILLTPAQIVVLEADVVALKTTVLAACSAYNVEPVEIPDP